MSAKKLLQRNMSSDLFLKAIFHVHTAYSWDSSADPKLLVEACIDYGIDILAVTDHGTIEGAKKISENAPFQVIIGEEVMAKEGGEIIALFITKEIPNGIPAQEIIRDIHDQNGVAGIAHPFDSMRGKTFPESVLQKISPKLDFTEMFNARTVSKKANRQAEEFARRHNLPVIVGSDAHTISEIGDTYMYMQPFKNAEEFLNSLHTAIPNTPRSSGIIRAAQRKVKRLITF